jgi:hypothetical protein
MPITCCSSHVAFRLSPFSFLSLTSQVPFSYCHLSSLASRLTSFVSPHSSPVTQLSRHSSFSDSSHVSVLSPVVFLTSSLVSFYPPLIVIFVLCDCSVMRVVVPSFSRVDLCSNPQPNVVSSLSRQASLLSPPPHTATPGKG